MNRLYTVESNLTLTGSMADHRLRLASSHMLALAGALAARITGDSTFAGLARGLDIKPAGWVEGCAADLAANKGESLVVVRRAPAAEEVHAVAHAINAALGNLGRTVEFVDAPVSGAVELGDLAAAIRAGSVRTLVIFGGNPVSTMPRRTSGLGRPAEVGRRGRPLRLLRRRDLRHGGPPRGGRALPGILGRLAGRSTAPSSRSSR